MARFKPQSQRSALAKRNANPTDKYVGARVRMRRRCPELPCVVYARQSSNSSAPVDRRSRHWRHPYNSKRQFKASIDEQRAKLAAVLGAKPRWLVRLTHSLRRSPAASHGTITPSEAKQVAKE
jgi:hypothetical protein